MALRLTPLVVVMLLLAGHAEAAQDRCAAARDLVASTREHLQPGAARAALQDAVEGFRRATELCPGLGDAYYFLMLLGTELKDTPRAENWRLKAEFYGSEAMKRREPLMAGGAPPPISPLPAAAAPAISARVSPFVRRKLALVVGVGQFKDERINALRYTAEDARAVAAALKDLCGFDDVTVLLDQDATTYRIKTEINKLAAKAGPEDLVVVYLSSHGSPENLDAAGVNYIVTYDTEVTNLYPTAYRMADLADDIIVRIKAERVVAFLDTCYSGGTFRVLPPGWVSGSRTMSSQRGVSTATLEDRLKATTRTVVVDSEDSGASGTTKQGIGRVIISASEQGERSWEHERIKHGYFTYYLLEALRSNPAASIEDIYPKLRTQVAAAVLSEQGQPQHPTIARSRDRVDLFLRDRAVAAPVIKPPTRQ